MLPPRSDRPPFPPPRDPFPPRPPVEAPKPPAEKKARKLSGSLLALSSAAIVTVYSIGYVNTHSSLDELTAAAATIAPTASPTTVPATTRRQRGNDAAVPPAATPQAPAATAPSSGSLRDGSFVGTGNSRHGSIQATVVIEGGKIVSAAVTACQTRYPCSDVDALVRATVQNQAVPTTNVSGATDSSRAYKQAVSSALAKARA